jgi:ABC-type phosphate transport system permease subunit
VNRALYWRRKAVNGMFLTLSVLAAFFGLIWLAFILGDLAYNGIASISPKLFTEMTPPPGAAGGLLNAIAGSLLMSGLAVAAGTPIGLFAGTYLAEYGRHKWLAFIVRFVNDILLSAPSIITGLFIYEIVVKNMGHFSGWAGAASLTIIVIPVHRHTSGRAHHREHAASGTERIARSRHGARCAAQFRYPGRHLACRASGDCDRHSARDRAHFRRDRTAALHLAEQSVLEHRS